MAESTLWWLLAGAAVAIELLTGTFYLLMLAVGLVAAALSAHAGASLTLQLVAAAAMGGGSVVAWYRIRQRGPVDPKASANRDVNLDIGEAVHVDAWHADGTATVKYRGANWTAAHAGDAPPCAGLHRIVEIQGSHLILEKT